MNYDEFLARAVIELSVRWPGLSAEQMAERANELWRVFELAQRDRSPRCDCETCKSHDARRRGVSHCRVADCDSEPDSEGLCEHHRWHCGTVDCPVYRGEPDADADAGDTHR